MNEVLTTAQVAEYLGTTPATVRSLKSRNKDQLIEGQHFINQDNQLLWTSAGLEALQVLKGDAPSVATDATGSVADAQPDILNRYIPLVESVASAVADGLLGLIDRAVTIKIGSAIATPMSAAECLSVLQDLGLKPCNPELLLSPGIKNLLTQSKEN